jgi:hypothetical protein
MNAAGAADQEHHSQQHGQDPFGVDFLHCVSPFLFPGWLPFIDLPPSPEGRTRRFQEPEAP